MVSNNGVSRASGSSERDSVGGCLTHRLIADGSLKFLSIKVQWFYQVQLGQSAPDLLNYHVSRAGLHQNDRAYKRRTVSTEPWMSPKAEES
jgi:hypothetical protein